MCLLGGRGGEKVGHNLCHILKGQREFANSHIVQPSNGGHT